MFSCNYTVYIALEIYFFLKFTSSVDYSIYGIGVYEFIVRKFGSYISIYNRLYNICINFMYFLSLKSKIQNKELCKYVLDFCYNEETNMFFRGILIVEHKFL